MADVHNYGHLLNYKSENLQNDIIKVFTGLFKNSEVLQYSIKNLRNHKDFNFKVIKINYKSLFYISDSFTNSIKFMLDC